MKFAQLPYFLSQNVGGDKRYYAPCPKVGRTCPPVPPLNSVPGLLYTVLAIITYLCVVLI